MSEIANNRVFKAAQIFTDVDSEFIIKNFNRGLLKEVFGCIDSEIRFKDFSDYYDKVIVTIKDKDDTKQKSINFNKLFKTEYQCTPKTFKHLYQGKQKESESKEVDK